MSRKRPGDNITGRFRVRAIRPAFSDVAGLFRRTRDKIEIRRQALKLRYWPDPSTATDSGQVVDLDWSFIKALPNTQIGELRVHDVIGGHDNLRIIFFKGPQVREDAMPILWVIRVMQKKRNDFSTHDLRTFRGRRTLVIERFYTGQ